MSVKPSIITYKAVVDELAQARDCAKHGYCHDALLCELFELHKHTPLDRAQAPTGWTTNLSRTTRREAPDIIDFTIAFLKNFPAAGDILQRANHRVISIQGLNMDFCN